MPAFFPIFFFFALLEGATCSLNVRARNTKRGRLNLEPVRSEANQMGKKTYLTARGYVERRPHVLTHHVKNSCSDTDGPDGPDGPNGQRAQREPNGNPTGNGSNGPPTGRPQ